LLETDIREKIREYLTGGDTVIKTKGVVHFTICVSDIERSERFYVDLLGMDVILRAGPLGMVFLRSGDDVFVLAKGRTPADPEPGREHLAHHAFLVDRDKFDESLAFLRANGVKIILEEDRQEGVFPGRQAYFHDPDRNVLEIIDRVGVSTVPAARARA
jgi:catechol 2,3-dioxygenase-like lactoylglutathione lyase family enzyme